MTSEPDSAAPGAAGAWPVLDVAERRVLGVLVEKAKTTPDAYPLSVNALMTGCNQKSNRDPVLNLGDEEVEEALTRCQAKGLAIKITGGRVVRWRHALYEAWNVNKLELAVLAELLLRGPQTEGELRGRASRMEQIADLDALRAVLRPLTERRLVLYLTPEGRGAVLTHGFHDPRELERLRAQAASQPVSAPPAAPAPVAAPPARAEEVPPRVEAALDEARKEIADLKLQVADLTTQLAGLREELTALRQSLGA